MYSVLLVDDDFFSLEGMKMGVHFQEIGFEQVFYATNMTSACEILKKHDIDVMVADIEMPGGSGLDLQKWVLAHEMPVVTMFLTCHASFEYAQDAIRLHIFDYVLKPLRYADFEQKLVRALHECPQWKNSKAAEKADAPATFDEEKSSLPLSVQIKQYIDNHISEELTREVIGALFFLNPDYVARMFKNEEGISLTAYIRTRRIRTAQRLLAETDFSIEEISQKVGYSYNTYFFNTFKEITGVSPSQYRKSKTE